MSLLMLGDSKQLMVETASQSGDEVQRRTPEWIVASLLILVEVSLLVFILSVYKGWASSSRALVGGLIALTAAILPSVYLLRLYLKSHAAKRRIFSLILAMNLVTMMAIGLVGEVLVRMSTAPNSQGVEAFGTTLFPKDWETIRSFHRRLLREKPMTESYLVSDDLLGWVVGPGRVSKDGLYMSSQEGIRSEAVGVSYQEPRKPYRVAVLGDSFTFGLGVTFKSSWGAQLESRMANTVEVLNFGVDGYGIDQAYLRYRRNAKPLEPKIVILAFIEHDLRRAMSVYPFITFPQWTTPFSKPRFAIQHNNVELVNLPLMAPNQLFETSTITSLPFLEYERGYVAEEWEWRWYHGSALVRYFVSRFPRWPQPSNLSSDDTMVDINVEILHRFVDEVEGAGAIPLPVYLPTRTDFRLAEWRNRDLVFAALRDKRISFADLTSCMKRDDYEVLFLPGDSHYSSEGNAQAAECLKPMIEERLHHGAPSV